MTTEQKEPTTTGRRRSRPGGIRRIREWWLASSVYGAWWRLSNWFFNWWHPRADETNGGYYGRRRISRPRKILHWIRNSLRLGGITRRIGFLNRLYDWWYPRSSPDGTQGGYYGGRRRNRLSRGLRSLRHWVRHSLPGRYLAMAAHRFYEWYFPLSGAEHGGHDHYGRRRRSRLVLAWRRVSRAVGQSWLGRQYGMASFRLYEWWYPLAQSSHTSGYYGRRRKSRPVLWWGSFRRAVEQTWVWRGILKAMFLAREWWYPPLQPGDLHGSHYQFRRVSRPVLYYRRWNRWFRKTWVGKEFGWLVDEVVDIVCFTRDRIVYDLQWHRVQRFISRPSTIAAMVVLLVCGVMAYRYGLPRYQQFVETRYAAQARLFLSKGDFARASLRARQALLMNQENVIATLVAADLAERGRSPQALYWRQRAATLAPTAVNRLALASAALKTEEFPFEITTRTLRSLATTEKATFEFNMAAAALSAKMGDLVEAEKLYALAVSLNPTNPAARMSLAVIRLQSKNPDSAQDSRTTLALLSSEGRMGVMPLQALVAEAFQRKDYPAAERLSTQLLTNSQASFSDGLLHAALLRAQSSTNFDAFLTDLQERAIRYPASVGELAAWMNQVGMARQAREWLGTIVEKAPGQTMLRLAVADSYVALREWSALQEWLEKERWVGMDHLRFAMLALAIRNQGPDTRYRVAWDRALALAGYAPTALNTLAKVTASWGWQDETEQVLWHAANRFKTAKWPLDKLKAIYTLRKESTGLRRVFQSMMQRDRTDKVAQNNFASLSLLLNKDTSQACAIAKNLYDAEPSNPLFVSTYAFALHFQGRTADGLAVLEKLKADDLSTPGMAAYHGILLAAAGRNEEAQAALVKAEKAFLLPEEKTLVNAAIKRTQ